MEELNKCNPLSWVYWVHLPEHTDMTKQGYVGITSLGVSKRFAAHVRSSRSSKNPTVFKRAIIKYSDKLVVTTVFEGSREQCLMLEYLLRPAENIGWNLAIGGVAPCAGKPLSEDHKQKLIAANTGRKHTKEQLDRNRSNGKKQMTFELPWQHPYSNKHAWFKADVLYDMWLKNPKIGRRSAGKILEISPESLLKVLSKIKDGWNPFDDRDWVLFKDQYEKECQNVASVV